MYCQSLANKDGSITFLWDEGVAITCLPSSVITPRSRSVYGGWTSILPLTDDSLTQHHPYAPHDIYGETFAFFRDSSEVAHSFIAWPSSMADTTTLLCNEGVTDAWQKQSMVVNIGDEKCLYTVLISPPNALTYIRMRLLK
jgi:hypothetical protein